jgi:hypothetical protein
MAPALAEAEPVHVTTTARLPVLEPVARPNIIERLGCEVPVSVPVMSEAETPPIVTAMLVIVLAPKVTPTATAPLVTLPPTLMLKLAMDVPAEAVELCAVVSKATAI